VPVAESIGALAGLKDEGKIRHIGVSNFSEDQLRRRSCRFQAPVRRSTSQNVAAAIIDLDPAEIRNHQGRDNYLV
jgi:diketogulonate reductase-like aldo/keto reductase